MDEIEMGRFESPRVEEKPPLTLNKPIKSSNNTKNSYKKSQSLAKPKANLVLVESKKSNTKSSY